MSGQFALVLVDESVVPAAAVWETLPPTVPAKVTIMLARLLAACDRGRAR